MALHLVQFCCAAFLAVLFLQSGLDKVLDWKGNREYLRGYQEKGPLKHFIGFQLFCLTALEVLAGVLSAAGALSLLVQGQSHLAQVGALLAVFIVLGLFVGQRLAKDYAGAAGLTGYFVVSVGSALLLGSR